MTKRDKEVTALMHFVVEGETVSEDGRFVARCPKLRLSATGENPAQAFERWQGIFAVYLDSCQKRNVLLRVLKNAGVKTTIFTIGEGAKVEKVDAPQSERERFKVYPLLTWHGGPGANPTLAAS